MPKKTHSIPLHFNSEQMAVVLEGEKGHKSRNAYFWHCVQVQRQISKLCADNGLTKEMADILTAILSAASPC